MSTDKLQSQKEDTKQPTTNPPRLSIHRGVACLTKSGYLVSETAVASKETHEEKVQEREGEDGARGRNGYYENVGSTKTMLSGT